MSNPIAAGRMAALWHDSMSFMTTTEGIANEIKERKNVCPQAGLKKIAFGLGLLENIPEKAEYVLAVGCFPPFITPGVLKSWFDVLRKYGVAFTVLDDEVCCGWLALEGAVAGEDWEALKKAEAESKIFMKENVDASVAKGARAMIHFCEWCLYANNWARNEGAFGEEGHKVEQQTLLAPIFDRLDKVNLKFDKPKTVGYYQGCHARTNAAFPGIEGLLDWTPYRRVLDRIDNAEVVDLPNTCCMLGAEKVIEDAKNRNIDVITCRCYPCSIYLTLVSKGTIPVKFITETLDEASHP